MEDRIVSKEVANLAKEKGFTAPVRKMYRQGELTKDTTLFHDWNSENNIDFVSAPTQNVLHKWLRDTFNIIADVVAYYDEEQLPLTKDNLQKPKGYMVWDSYALDFAVESAALNEDFEETMDLALLGGLELIKV